MRYKFIIVYLVVISVCGHTQTKEVYYDQNWGRPYNEAAVKYYALLTKTDSGWYRKDYQAYDKKTLVATGLYADSICRKKNGLYTRYYPDGKPALAWHYRDNLPHGTCISFYPNGIKKDSITYQYQVPVGISKKWHMNGVPAEVLDLGPNGTGLMESWFENGKLSAKGPVVLEKSNNGFRGLFKNGKWDFFRDSGTISAVVSFRNDTLISKTYYNESGDTINSTTLYNRQAMFTDGESGWNNFTRNKASIPSTLVFPVKEYVMAEIVFTIDRSGIVKDAYVSNSFHPEIDRLALEIVKSSPKWQPAFEYNRYVSTTRKYWVGFD